MNMIHTQCCAAMELYGFGTNDDAKGHMISICGQIWPPVNRYNPTDCGQKPFSHYTFSGVVKYRGAKDGRYSAKAPTLFAKFIRKHKLGKVVGSVPEWNRVNHPTHLVRVWVWTPDVENLKAWWKENRPERFKPKVEAKVEPVKTILTINPVVVAPPLDLGPVVEYDNYVDDDYDDDQEDPD